MCCILLYRFTQLLTILILAPGKTASLGEMIQNLTPLGVSVPGGFGVSSSAYDAVLDRFELRERLGLLLKDVDVNDLEDLAGKFVASCVKDRSISTSYFYDQSMSSISKWIR